MNIPRVALLLSALLHLAFLLWQCSPLPLMKKPPAQMMLTMQLQPAPVLAAEPPKLQRMPAAAPRHKAAPLAAKAPALSALPRKQFMTPATLAATPISDAQVATTQSLSPNTAQTEQAASPTVVPQATRVAQPVSQQATQYLSNPAPAYPLLSRRLGEQSRVLLRVAVRADGGVASVVVEQSSGFARLDEAARSAVLRWRFHSARKNGEAINDEVLVPMPFRLND